jgi:hypothetical protein
MSCVLARSRCAICAALSGRSSPVVQRQHHHAVVHRALAAEIAGAGDDARRIATPHSS